jgi:hypothetical protein
MKSLILLLKETDKRFDDRFGYLEFNELQSIKFFNHAEIKRIIKEMKKEIMPKKEKPPFRIKAGMVGENHPQKDECGYCWAKEGSYHKEGCKTYEVELRNLTINQIKSNITHFTSEEGKGEE